MNFFDFMQGSAQVIYSSIKLFLRWFIDAAGQSNHFRIFLFLSLLVTLTTVTLTFISGLISGIKPSISGFDAGWFMLFVPPNTIGCLTALVAGKVSLFVFRWKVVGISAVAQMKTPTGIDLNYVKNSRAGSPETPPETYY